MRGKEGGKGQKRKGKFIFIEHSKKNRHRMMGKQHCPERGRVAKANRK